MARIHRRTVQKNLQDQDNHDGVITHLEPDILECEVKWALESIAMNKAILSDGIPVELFQILKDDALRVLHSIASKFGKISSGHRTRKGPFSFQLQRKAMPKSAQTTAQLHSSHMLVKLMLKILQARLQQYMSHELPDVQAGFRKGRGTRDQIANTHWIMEKAREFQKNIYFCLIDDIKAFDCADHNKLWKILKEMGILDHLNYLLEKLYAGQEATVRTGHGTTDWFQILEKEYVKAVYCHLAYLTYIQSTSCEMQAG